MTGKATALSHGAATIVNAIALGKGAAFGVNLSTKAEVALTDEPAKIRSEITSDPLESPALIEKTVTRIFQHFGVEKRFGAKVRTYSDIPIARGLKSSSAAANAVAVATVAALGETLKDLDIVNLGVEAAFDARVTVTGAFDDACACYFGGAVVADNLRRRLVKRFTLPADLTVLFHVPSKKAYTGNSDVEKLKLVKPLAEIAFKEARKGKLWSALSLNGLVYSAALGYDASIALDALAAGAVAAGLCGKGPAVTAVMTEEKVDLVKQALERYEGIVLKTCLNHEKAKVITQG